MAHPRTFLRHYPVRIAGANLPSGVVPYWIWYWQASERPGGVLRTLHMHATDAYRISSQAAMAGPHAHNFNAHSVYMEQSNVAPVALYQIPAGTPPNILVTGALSGCSFIVDVGPNPGDIACAHLQPNGEDGHQLHARLKPNYNYVYGLEKYDHTAQTPSGPLRDRNVTIIGVRIGGNWKIYAQKLDVMNAFAIRSVHRIYPPD
jgi:hypothetical protein